jgi:hypothetical protein
VLAGAASAGAAQTHQQCQKSLQCRHVAATACLHRLQSDQQLLTVCWLLYLGAIVTAPVQCCASRNIRKQRSRASAPANEIKLLSRKGKRSCAFKCLTLSWKIGSSTICILVNTHLGLIATLSFASSDVHTMLRAR